MAHRLARKVKRAGKSATQFRFTSTLEYMEVTCKGTWRPEHLRVIWLRNHRRVHSQTVQWVATDDQGPNGAEGKAVFDPPIAISLIVTLYRDTKKAKFEAKDYKYYIENEGIGGKKILAAFTANLAEFIDVTTTKHRLDMKLEPMSKKIRQAILGLMIEAEFMKEGRSEDDDMQSTFSAMSLGAESLQFDDDDDEDELDEAATIRAGSEAAGGLNADHTSNHVNGSDKMLLSPSPNHVGCLEEEKSSGNVATASASNGLGELKTSLPNGLDEQASSAPNGPNDIEPGEVEAESSKAVGTNKPTAESSKAVGTNKPTEPSTKQGLLASPTLVQSGNSPPRYPDQPEQKLTPEKDAPSSLALKEAPQQQQQQTKEPTTVESLLSGTGAQPSQHNTSGSSKASQAAAMSPANGYDFFYQTSLLLASPTSNGPSNQGPGAVGVDSSKGVVGTDKPTESSTNQSSLASPTPAPNNSSAPRCPIQAEEKLMQEKSAPSSLAVSEGPLEQQQNKQAAIGSPLSGRGTQPSQSNTSGIGKLGQAAAMSPANGYDFFYQTSLLLGNDRIVPPPSHDDDDDGVNTSDEHGMKEESVSPEPDSVTSTWLPDLSLVDKNNASASNSRVEEAQVIGLYFSAQWCQPCRRFLPKLIRLYKILHKNQKPFEVIYISNDNSKAEMTTYMDEQKMPWVALPYGHALIKKLKRGFNVKSIPMLKIVSVDGSVISENARKLVEAASVESAVLKLFAQWAAGGRTSPEDRRNRNASSPSLLTSIKKTLTREDSLSSSSPDSPRGKGRHEHGNEAELEELLQKITEKDQKVRHLEEVNMSLKQTNDDLNEDVANLKMKLKQAEEKLEKLQQSTNRLIKEEQTLKAQMELRGWLYKRGIRGPTAHVWRRRFFRLDQGSKICYYKTATERSPQGFIDLLKVVNVSEVSPAHQDKNNATFHVQCEGRTYQLQAVDETAMRKWMTAIEYLRGFYGTQGRQ